jgi:hypothetical protein
MALIPENAYPGRINPANAAYPLGSARNITVPGDDTGTPLVAGWINDMWGYFQRLLSEGGITASGNPDTVQVTQYYDALIAVINAQIPAAPVSSVFGRTGAVVAALNDYAASQVNNDSGVAGATVAAALDTLAGAGAPVSSVFGRTGAVVAAANDYDASEVNNDSGVTGATVAAALDTLAAASGAQGNYGVVSNTGSSGTAVISTAIASDNAVYKACVHLRRDDTTNSFNILEDGECFFNPSTNTIISQSSVKNSKANAGSATTSIVTNGFSLSGGTLTYTGFDNVAGLWKGVLSYSRVG